MTEREYVVEKLAEVYRPEGCAIWMAAPNQLLGGISPDALIEAGESWQVLGLIAALADGVVM